MLKVNGLDLSLSPYKIALLAIIPEVIRDLGKFCRPCNTGNCSAHINTLKIVKEKNLHFLLKCLCHVDDEVSFPNIYKWLGDIDIRGHSLLDHVKRILSNLASLGVEGLTDLMDTCDNLLAGVKSDPLSRSSVVGLFIRSMILAFQRTTFSEKVKVMERFQEYIDTKSVSLKIPKKTKSKLLTIYEKIEKGYLSEAILETHLLFDRLQGKNASSKLPDKMGQALLVLAKVFEHFGLKNEIAYSAREALVSSQELHMVSNIEESKKILLINGIISSKQLLQFHPSTFGNDKSGLFTLISKLSEVNTDRAKLISFLNSVKERKHNVNSKMQLSKLWNLLGQPVLGSVIENMLTIVTNSRKSDRLSLHSKYGSVQLLYKLLSFNKLPLNIHLNSEDIEYTLLKLIATVESMNYEMKKIAATTYIESISGVIPAIGFQLQGESNEGFGILDCCSPPHKSETRVGFICDKVSEYDSIVLQLKHFLFCGNYGNAILKGASIDDKIQNSLKTSDLKAICSLLRSSNLPTFSVQLAMYYQNRPFVSDLGWADLLFEKVSSELCTADIGLSMDHTISIVKDLEKCAVIFKNNQSYLKLKDAYFLLSVVYHQVGLFEDRNCAAKKFKDLDETHRNCDFEFFY
ncbi:uncharacterized protein LOC136031249 isoform X1 [Artemia franciscana]